MAIFNAGGEYSDVPDLVSSKRDLKYFWKRLKKVVKDPLGAGAGITARELRDPNQDSFKGGFIAKGVFDVDQKTNKISGVMSDFRIYLPKNGYPYEATGITLDINDSAMGKFKKFRKKVISQDDVFDIWSGPAAELDGGRGNDYFDLIVDYAKVTGGKGMDRYYFRPDQAKKGTLLITDFSSKNDSIQIDAVDATSLEVSTLGNNTVLEIGTNKEVIFRDRILGLEDIDVVI